MTGLNLETFLHLLRADLGAWATLALIATLLGLMAWTSWGSRRALRKCLVLSVVAHVGLALYGGTAPAVLRVLNADGSDLAARPRIREIKVLPSRAVDGDPGGSDAAPGAGVGGSKGLAAWDRSTGGLALADAKLTAPRTPEPPAPEVRPSPLPAVETAAAAPDTQAPAPPEPEARARDE